MDPDLLVPPAPRTGSRFAISQISEPSYKRLSRTIDAPSRGGQLSFWVTRDTEPNWDHFFVEAHTVGRDDWTTLQDLNGHNARQPGAACAGILGLYPFLRPHRGLLVGHRQERRLRAVDGRPVRLQGTPARGLAVARQR